MKITLFAFAIAKDILGGQKVPFTLEEGDTISDLKQKLVQEYPDFAKLVSFAIAVNCIYETDDFTLSPEDEIAIIPPVSGG